MLGFSALEFPIVAQYSCEAASMFGAALQTLDAIPFGTEGRAEAVAKLETTKAVMQALTRRVQEMREARKRPPEVDAEGEPVAT
jgi:hypothetical protein